MSSEQPGEAQRGVGRVRLADLRCDVANEVWQTAVRRGVCARRLAQRLMRDATQAKDALASLSATGALVLALDDGTAEGIASLLASAEELFAAPAAAKHAHSALSDACGATGYRELPGKELYDFRPNAANSPPAPEVLQHTAPRAYDLLSAAGRDLLAAVSWSFSSATRADTPVDLVALCEATCPPQAMGASVLSLFRYHAGGLAAPHEDRGLLTLVACTCEGLEVLPNRPNHEQWLPLELAAGDVAVLAGVTLAAATHNTLQPATHRVQPQATQRDSVVLRLRGAAESLLPPMSVRVLEALLARTSTSVNRDHGGTSGVGSAAGGDGGLLRTDRFKHRIKKQPEADRLRREKEAQRFAEHKRRTLD